MDARAKFFVKKISKTDLGLEIGPSHNPLVMKRDGYNIRIVDHTNREGLVKKYEAMGIDTTKIEEVDYVWDGESTLSELIKSKKKFSYIVASHLIEHTTDLVAFLNDCESLLAHDGRLMLAIPDKRYCFDRYRTVTTIGDVLEAYEQKRTRHTPGKVYDFIINSVGRGGSQGWSREDTRSIKPLYDDNFAKYEKSRAESSKEYIDIHNWMFTPASFKLLIRDLQSLGLTGLSFSSSLPTQGFEFFEILSPSSKKIKTPRIKLLQEMHKDLKEMFDIDETSLKLEIATLKEENKHLKEEVSRIVGSKRWRYSEKAAKTINSLKRATKKR